jgi:RNA polymerase sigma factor (TIGR02999 family)
VGYSKQVGAYIAIMTDATQTTVTRLLYELQNGNRAALDELFPVIYDELRWLAHRQRGRWHGDNTLNTTALIHELYLKLDDQKRIGADGRAHFFAVAAKAMRHILSNYARARKAKKRGNGLGKLSLDEMKVLTEQRCDEATRLPVMMVGVMGFFLSHFVVKLA